MKIARHSNAWVNAPPRDGPTAAPSAAAPAHDAGPSSASAPARTNPPPTPCTARKATSTGSDAAAAHPIEAAANTARPASRSGRERSRAPPSSTKPPATAAARLYAVTTHAVAGIVPLNRDRRWGSASTTIPESAAASATAATRRRRDGRGMAILRAARAEEAQDVAGVVLPCRNILPCQPHERFERDLARADAPACGGPSADESEGAEEPIDRDDAVMGAEQRLTRRPAEEDGVERAEQARRRQRRRRRSAGKVDEPVPAQLELGGDGVETGAGVTQRKPRPSGEVALAGGAVAREVAPRELGQGALAVDGSPGQMEPVAHEHVGVLMADHRPPHGDSAQRRE